jgi:hypothetical protein
MQNMDVIRTRLHTITNERDHLLIEIDSLNQRVTLLSLVEDEVTQLRERCAQFNEMQIRFDEIQVCLFI